MKVWKILLCALMLAMPVFANETDDRQTATSLKYVTHELDTRQDKLSAGQNKAIEYTDSAGDVTQRTVKSDLASGSTSDISLPTVSAVTGGLNTKQNVIDPIDDHTAVTYTGSVGGIGTKGIYQTSGTYADQSDNLIDAKTFNAALKTGLDNEFVCDEDNRQPVTNYCWLYKIHTATTNSTLPDGYTQLEYIESTGTQYINTGITDVTDSEFTLVAQQTELLSNYPTMLGAMDNSTAYKVVFAYGSSNRFYTQTGAGDRGYVTLGSQDLNKHTFNLVSTGNVHTFTIDGTLSTIGNYATVDTTTYPLFLCARNRFGTVGNQTKQKVFSFSAKKNGVLIQNLIPAKYGNDIGMYDTVSGEFFENVGDGVFRAGPVVNNNVYIPQNQ